jgi:hypothetical protein
VCPRSGGRRDRPSSPRTSLVAAARQYRASMSRGSMISTRARDARMSLSTSAIAVTRRSCGGSVQFWDHLFGIAACLDGLENGSHVSVTETERAGFVIERVANIEQWRGDARLPSRFGD